MIQKITAFMSSDGKVFASERDAAFHDAECAIKALDVFQHPVVLAILKHARALTDALTPLAQAYGDIATTAEDTSCQQ